MKTFVDANFSKFYSDMVLEFNRCNVVSYKTRAGLAQPSTFYHTDNDAPGDAESVSPICQILNNNLFKTCALKTAYLCDFSWRNRLLEIVDSLDPKSPDVDDSLAKWCQESLFTKLENELCLREDENNQDGIMAGYSCAMAIAANVDLFDFDSSAENETDTEISNWDSAFFSSIAVAHGAEWERDKKVIDIKARTEFWNWYVFVAVPDAFNFAMQCI